MKEYKLFDMTLTLNSESAILITFASGASYSIDHSELHREIQRTVRGDVLYRNLIAAIRTFSDSDEDPSIHSRFQAYPSARIPPKLISEKAFDSNTFWGKMINQDMVEIKI